MSTSLTILLRQQSLDEYSCNSSVAEIRHDRFAVCVSIDIFEELERVLAARRYRNQINFSECHRRNIQPSSFQRSHIFSLPRAHWCVNQLLHFRCTAVCTISNATMQVIILTRSITSNAHGAQLKQKLAIASL